MQRQRQWNLDFSLDWPRPKTTVKTSLRQSGKRSSQRSRPRQLLTRQYFRNSWMKRRIQSYPWSRTSREGSRHNCRLQSKRQPSNKPSSRLSSTKLRINLLQSTLSGGQKCPRPRQLQQPPKQVSALSLPRLRKILSLRSLWQVPVRRKTS